MNKLFKKSTTLIFISLSILGYSKGTSNDVGTLKHNNTYDYENNIKNLLVNHGSLVGNVVSFSDKICNLEGKNKQMLTQKESVLKLLNSEQSRIKSFDTVNYDRALVDSILLYYQSLKNLINNEYDIAVRYKLEMKQNHDHMMQFFELLSKADSSFVNGEKKLYSLENRYASKHKFNLPSSEEKIIKDVLSNDSLIRYHNIAYLQFVKVTYKEIEYFDAYYNTHNAEFYALRKDFIKTLYNAEQILNKLGSYNNDPTLQGNVKAFVNFVKKQHCKDATFFTEYVDYVNEMNGLDKSKNAARVSKTGTSKVSEYDNKGREVLMNNVETVSYHFLKLNAPKFEY